MNFYSIFICPECKNKLEYLEEKFICNKCRNVFFKKEGVIDFSNLKIPDDTKKTIEQFGELWRIFNHVEEYHRDQFLNWVHPLKKDDFKGKKVLEAGCGKGRHTIIVSSFDPESLFAIDLSESIYIAGTRLKEKNCIFSRCNINTLPFEDESFDIIFSVGVVHHLIDPESGIRELWRVLKKGGKLCVWVYAREGNLWLLIFVNPIRKLITSKLPVRILKLLSKPLTIFLYLMLKLIYGPSTHWGTQKSFLPYSPYLGSISVFPLREIENIVVDHLAAPVSHYFSKEEIESIFKKFNPDELLLRWHNQNSWTVVAKK